MFESKRDTKKPFGSLIILNGKNRKKERVDFIFNYHDDRETIGMFQGRSSKSSIMQCILLIDRHSFSVRLLHIFLLMLQKKRTSYVCLGKSLLILSSSNVERVILFFPICHKIHWSGIRVVQDHRCVKGWEEIFSFVVVVVIIIIIRNRLVK